MTGYRIDGRTIKRGKLREQVFTNLVHLSYKSYFCTGQQCFFLIINQRIVLSVMVFETTEQSLAIPHEVYVKVSVLIATLHFTACPRQTPCHTVIHL